ncbi:MAG: bifunctional diaminohydroxyphosphoribosylaminopyrimidine deaminase/5-amino-6-(5-phosphoribosylamino)uracil reductase RibD [Amylibacter sp.]
MTPKETDERWMRLALTLGQRGLGQVWPNPAVGCVIVKNDCVVGRGWTQVGGRPHAEVHALAQAGSSAHGATAYVTLEPCSHHGKSGPCAEALISAGVKRVVTAITDPDPRVSGKGHDILRAAGLEVVEGVLRAQADDDHQGFFQKTTMGRPLVTLKLASSIDGRIATQTGDSRWITAPTARRSVHLMRARHDAILVGRNTVIADDPDLSVRDLGLADRSPVRVVLDSHINTPSSSRLVQSSKQIQLWIFHLAISSDTNALAEKGAQLFPCKPDEMGRLDIVDVLKQLADQGITRLMVEGGGQIAASLLKANCVDRLALYSAGVAIGAEGLPTLAGMGITALKDAPRFEHEAVTELGPDVLSLWKRSR